MIHAAKKTLEEAGEHASDDERGAIEAAIAEAEEAVKGDDKDVIEAATTKLTEVTSGVAQKMYAAQAEAGDAAGEQVPEEDAVDGDVVDAEFEEVREDDKR
jgi:molecular chaperone DnaK